MTDRDAHAGVGGTGAPPPVTESNKVATGLTREYARPEIRVHWYASRCIHSAACIRAAPAVFDPTRRPWIDLSGADPDAIARAVERCPTSALQYERTDGVPGEEAPIAVQVTPVRNGPYFVRGRIEILDGSGAVAQVMTRAALCRCGQSKHMPLCDNTHRAIGFRSTEGSLSHR